MGVEVKASVLAAVVCGVALGAPLEVEAGWAEVEKIELVAPSDNAQAGAALDIEGDRLVLGAANQRTGDIVGAVYVYERDEAGAWVEVAELLPSVGVFPDFFGASVSLDGDRVLVGASFTTGVTAQSGAAYVFERDAAGSWVEVAKLIQSAGAARDRFGAAVQLDGDTAVVGAYDAEGGATKAGAAYVFERDATGAWTQTQKLVSPTPASDQFFGFALSLDGARVCVSASREGNGAVHVFERGAAGQWTHEARIDAPPSPPRRNADDFATSVSLDGDRLLVGDRSGTLQGLARVYERDAAGAWAEVATLDSTTSMSGDFFGGTVALSGDRAVVGSTEDANGEESGAVYVYERDAAGVWTQSARLVASDGAAEDRFGDALAISGGRLAIGAYLVDAAESNSGAVYVFDSTPRAVDDAVATDEDTAVVFDPLANDAVDAGATVGGLAAFSAGGAATVDAAGVITYTPAPDYFGEETFTYTITQGADSVMGVVTVAVAPVNDAPVASDGQVEVVEGQPITITLVGSDVEGDALTFSIDAPLNGSVTGAGPEVVYTPTAGFVGVDQFTFTVDDGQDSSEPASVVVTVLAGGDADAGGGDAGSADVGGGAPDAGAGEGDAGGVSEDAGPGAADAGSSGEQGQGCCATASTRPRAPALAWLALIGLVGAVRRRRAGR